MKAKVIAVTIALTVALTAPVYADVYVKVDADGNALSGAIVCDYSVCGDPNSEFNKYNTNAGERWVLQASNGAQAGFGKSNNPTEQVKVNLDTNVWTETTPTSTRTILPEPVFTDTPTSIIDSATVTIDSATVIIDSATVTSTTDKTEVIATIQALLSKVFALLALLGIKG